MPATKARKKKRPGPKVEKDYKAPIGPNAKQTAGICKALIRGNPLGTASWLVGIPNPTVVEWLKRGCRADASNDKDPLERKFAAFYRAVQVANAEADNRDMTHVDGSDDWRAHAWKLTHRHPNRYAKHVEHRGKVDHAHGGTVQHVAHVKLDGVEIPLAELSLEAKRRILEATRAVKGEQAFIEGRLPIGLKELPNEPDGTREAAKLD